jgi:hypothetical protein
MAEVADPKKHAAELLDQADRLTLLARELRREARRLNASLGNPVPQPKDSRRRAEGSGSRSRGSTVQPAAAGERRFAPEGEVRHPVTAGTDGSEDGLPISHGARLMITNLATAGSSREEILTVMRDELGLENADAILDRLIV